MGTASTGRLLRLSEVRSRTALGRSTIYRLMRNGDFPEPLKIGARAVRWRESEIEEWLAARPRATGDTPQPDKAGCAMPFAQQGLCPHPFREAITWRIHILGTAERKIIVSLDGEIPKCIEGKGKAK